MHITYNKPPLSIDEMIELLSSRGMVFHDTEKAKTFLSQVNYYKLSGYWTYFQDKATNNFKIPLFFENVIDIYRFDSKLRSLCFNALEKIEIALHSCFSEHMCNKYGAYWFEDDSNIQKLKNRAGILITSPDMVRSHFVKLVQENKSTQFIRNFQKKYINELPPYWILAQIIPFGSFSKLFSAIKKEDRAFIANLHNMPDTFLMNSLKNFAYTRNICAHYSRLWNKHLMITAPSVSFRQEQKYPCFYSGHDTFSLVYLISYFLHKLTPESKWCSLIKNLIDRYEAKTFDPAKQESLVSYKKMGFPDDWDKLPLFEKMLLNG